MPPNHDHPVTNHVPEHAKAHPEFAPANPWPLNPLPGQGPAHAFGGRLSPHEKRGALQPTVARRLWPTPEDCERVATRVWKNMGKVKRLKGGNFYREA